jgi:hypothetical protein
MRYLWRLGGDSRCVTPVAANAAVSPASRATAARPASGRPRPAMTRPGDAEAAKVSASAGQSPHRRASHPIGRCLAAALHDLRAVRSRVTAAWREALHVAITSAAVIGAPPRAASDQHRPSGG